MLLCAVSFFCYTRRDTGAKRVIPLIKTAFQRNHSVLPTQHTGRSGARRKRLVSVSATPARGCTIESNVPPILGLFS